MRGFLVGSLVLIVGYVALQPNGAKAAATGSNVLVQGLRRMLSASVAGLPARAGAAATTTGSSTSTSSGGSPIVNV